MSRRVLVCLEDAGVAHVVTARLQRDGVEGLVIERPTQLVEEARRGAIALAVQDRYRSGEAGSSLLRQVRAARNEVVPAIIVVTGELAAVDRRLLQQQYKVSDFLAPTSTTNEFADALCVAAGIVPGGAPDVAAADADGESISAAIAASFGSFDDDEDQGQKTLEVSRADLRRLAEKRLAVGGPDSAAMPTLIPGGEGPPTAEGTLALLSEADVARDDDLSQLPVPGGDDDVLVNATREQPAARASVSFDLPPTNAVQAQSPLPTTTTGQDQDNTVQIQELQRTQNKLRESLMAERSLREAAQKRVEELEDKLAKLGDAPRTPSQGLPGDGAFEELRYAALLARCRAEAFTGAIQMHTGGTARTVFLKDGLPVAYHSSEPGQRIGKVLVAQGHITDEQYMKAATRMVEKSIKLTDALVELGLIDAVALAAEQRNLTRDQIIQGFEITQGRFTVQAGQQPDANTPVFDFGPGEIYVQGYRRYAPQGEMLATYETLRDKYLQAGARLSSYRPKLGLGPDDDRLLRLLGEALTVEEAVERAGVGAEGAARLLAALQALDLVEEWSPGVDQFRSRLRAERQRHAEEIAQLHADARARERKLLDAFERALAGLGRDASSLRDSDALSTTSSVTPTGAAASTPPAASASTAPVAATSALAGPAPSSNAPVSSASPGSGRGASPLASSHIPGLSSASSSSSSRSDAVDEGTGRESMTPRAARSEAPRSDSMRSDSVRSESASGGSRSSSSSLPPGVSSIGSSLSSPSGSGASTSSMSSLSSAGSGVGASSPSSSLSSSPSASSSASSSSSSASRASLAPTGAEARSIEIAPALKPVEAKASASSTSTSPFAAPPGEPGGPADARYRDGLAQARAGQLDDAEVTLREAVKMDAARPDFLMALARVLLANPRYERSGTLPVVRSLLDRASTIAPGNTDVLDLLAQVRAEMGT